MISIQWRDDEWRRLIGKIVLQYVHKTDEWRRQLYSFHTHLAVLSEGTKILLGILMSSLAAQFYIH